MVTLKCLDMSILFLMKMFKKLRRSRKGVAAMVIALVVALVTISVVISVGVLLQSSLSDALNVISSKSSSTTKAENITYDVFTNVYSAYSLSAVVPLIAVAGLIITIVVASFAVYRSRR